MTPLLNIPSLILCHVNSSVSFSLDVNKRYEAYGWHVQTVADVNDLQAVRDAIAAAKAETGRPSMIKVHCAMWIHFSGFVRINMFPLLSVFIVSFIPSCSFFYTMYL